MRNRSLRLRAASSSLLVVLSLVGCSSDPQGHDLGPATSAGSTAQEGGSPSNEAAGPVDDGALADLVLEAPAEVVARRGESVAFDVKLTGSAWSDVTMTLAGAPPGVTLEKTADTSGSLTLGSDASAAVGDFELTLIAKSGDRTSSRQIVFTVAGAPGSLDTSFGNNGKVAFGSSYTGRAMIADPSGRLLVLYDSSQLVHVARLKWDGTLDESFDEDGITNVTFIPGAPFQYAKSFTLLEGGDIAVVGESGTGNAFSTCLARLDSAGQRTGLDGDGRVCLSGGNAAQGRYVMPLGADGILVTGALNGAPSAWKVNASGQLDTAFGDGDGTTVWKEDGDPPYARPLPLGSGFLLPVGATTKLSLVRFDAKGELMTSFGDAGRIILSGHTLLSATPGPGGRSFVATHKGGKRYALVLDSAGHGDAAFGDSGVIELSHPSGWVERVYPSDKPSELFAAVGLEGHAYLGRIDVHGVPDASFGGNGAVSVESENIMGLTPLPRSRVAVFTVDGVVFRLWR